MRDFLDRFSLKGKNALVICPDNPCGAEIAAGLHAAGADIYLAGAQKGEYAYPVKGSFPHELSSAESAAALEQAVRAGMPSLDIVVYNGLHTELSGWTQSFAEINDQLQGALFGMMRTIQALGHILSEQGAGSVLIVTDYGALVGYDPVSYRGCEEYKAHDFSYVKGFISGGAVNYVRQASNFLAENGCRINALALAPLAGSSPAAFEEAFIRHSQVKRMANADDIVNAAVFLASDASAYITGVTLPVDGGYTAK